MKVKLFHALSTSLLIISAAYTACGWDDCVPRSCDEYGGNADTNVSICQRPQGDCGDGCTYWKVLDTDGNKISECADSEPGNCKPFMEGDARDYCTIGHTVGCGQAGSSCSASGDCCAGLFCTVNTCG